MIESDWDKASDVLKEVLDERHAQEAKWGQQNHGPGMWYMILGEEVGESARAVLERDLPNLREELIQVAAVACAWVESLDRNELINDHQA